MTYLTEEQRLNEELIDQISEFYDDPLGHVLFSYPWGEGSLHGRTGPQVWQADLLMDIGQSVRDRGFNGVDAVPPIQYATASGHGIGKSAEVAWIIRWLMDTRPYAKGTVTANTNAQLKAKTWGELAKWHQLGITRHWWTLTSGSGSLSYYHKDFPEQWRCDGQTCREENSEAFAGQHAANSTSFYIFDEASAIPDKIYEVREGGLTDGEPHTYDFGNPTRNSGRFYLNMKGKYRDQYIKRFIDSRDVEQTNKELFENWRKIYGEDSDFFKVRVRGVFPDASSLQLIPHSHVEKCKGLDVYVGPSDPLIMGVDVARFGDDKSVIHLRQGRDAESQGKWVFHGLSTDQLATRIVSICMERNVDAVFIDGGGVGGGVVDLVRALGVECIEINFGSKATIPGRYYDMRTQMWCRMAEALEEGIRLDEDDEDLHTDLTAVEYGFTVSGNLKRIESKDEMKKRGMDSPDHGDALALTYALPVYPSRVGYKGDEHAKNAGDYDPYNN